jgi:DNA polymerase-1
MVARNPGQRDSFIADMRFVDGLLKGVNASDALQPKAFRYVMTKQGLHALAAHLKVVEGYSFDIETVGFDEFKPDSKIISIAITTWMPGELPSEVWSVPLYHPESPFRKTWKAILKWLYRYMRMPKFRAAHNGKFDLRWLRQFGMPNLTLTFDTMLAAHLLDENRPKSLDSLARTLLGAPAWKIDNKNLIDEPLRKVLKYNGLDTWNTAHIYVILRNELIQRPRLMKIMKYIMVPASNAFTQIEMKGIWVDTEKLATNSKIAKETLDDLNEQLMQHVPDKSLWPANIKEVNFNASNFARWWLFEYLNLPVGHLHDHGKGDDPGEEQDQVPDHVRVQRRILDPVLGQELAEELVQLAGQEERERQGEDADAAPDGSLDIPDHEHAEQADGDDDIDDVQRCEPVPEVHSSTLVTEPSACAGLTPRPAA